MSRLAMGKRRLLWQFYFAYLLVTLFSLLAVSVYVSSALRNSYRDRTAEELLSRAWLVADSIGDRLTSRQVRDVDTLCKTLGKRAATRITVVMPDGRVVGDSEHLPERMENHADRPEIINALAGQTIPSVRFSHTLRQEMMYVAIALQRGGQTIGILRTSVPLPST